MNFRRKERINAVWLNLETKIEKGSMLSGNKLCAERCYVRLYLVLDIDRSGV